MVIVRRSLPLRVLCLLLIACVLCCSCLMPYAQAVVIAGAAAYGAVELIAAMLIGGGVVYASSDDARSAAAQVYDWVATNASAALDKINFWVAQAIVSGVSTGIRVSQDVWDAIASAFNNLFSSDSLEFGREYVVTDRAEVDSLGKLLADVTVKSFRYVPLSDGAEYEYYLVPEYNQSNHCYYLALYSNGVLYDQGRYYQGAIEDYRFEFSRTAGSLYVSVYALVGSTWWYQDDISSFSTREGTYAFSGDSVAPDLVFPSDNSLVRVPDLPDVQTDEEGTEVVVYPDLSLNPTDHLADIPKGETGEQVDVPYDTLVDVETGQQVGEDVENPDIPSEGTDTGLIQNILDKITNFFDSPSDFKLDFDGFKNLILPDRFPFCIPFDLINSVRVFAASASDFVFRIDLDTSYFSVHHTVDLAPFAVPIAFFRYTCVLFWIWVLITRTRDLMKW